MKKYIILLFFALATVACDDMDIMNPKLQGILSAEETVHTAQSCEQLMIGIYSDMYFNTVYTSGFPGIMSGVLKKTFTGKKNAVYYIEKPEYAGTLNNTDRTLAQAWGPNYRMAAGANLALLAINGVDNDDFNEGRKDELLGEAYFLRAWAHYNILKNFGHWWTENPKIAPNVNRAEFEPYGIIYRNSVMTLDNIHQEQLSVKESYDNIYADLDMAIKLIGDFEDPTRANKLAAKALKARLALMRGDWTEAKEMATQVIESNDRALETSFQDVFKNKEDGSEIIFCRAKTELEAANSYTCGRAYSLLDGGWGPTKYFKDLISGDPREPFIWQVGNNGWDVLNKLCPNDELAPPSYFIRLSEMYLIKAEAELNSTGNALETITNFRTQRGITTTETNAEKLIFEEWLKEMSFENGLEWLACIRFNKLFETNVLLKAEYTDETIVVKYAQKLPAGEMNANNKLNQNPGYND